MLQLVSGIRGGGAIALAEPSALYRRRYDRDGAMDITACAERRVSAVDPDSLARVLLLAGQLQTLLKDNHSAFAIWLELEESIHAYWLEMSAAHYDLGVEHEEIDGAGESGVRGAGVPEDNSAVAPRRIGAAGGVGATGGAERSPAGSDRSGARTQKEEVAALLRQLADVLDRS